MEGVRVAEAGQGALAFRGKGTFSMDLQVLIIPDGPYETVSTARHSCAGPPRSSEVQERWERALSRMSLCTGTAGGCGAVPVE